MKIRIGCDPLPMKRARTTTRNGKTWTYSDRACEALKLKIAHAAKSHGFVPIKGPVRIMLYFYLRRPKSRKKAAKPDVRPDLDNYAKLVLDALNGIAWQDDGQITTMLIGKRYVEDDPYIFVNVINDR